MGNNSASIQFENNKIQSELKPKIYNGCSLVLNYYRYSFILYGIDIYEYSIKKKEWNKLEIKGKIPNYRIGHSGIGYHELVYYFGGEDENNKKLNDMITLNMMNNEINEIEQLGDIPKKRSNHSVTWKNGMMILYGGESSKNEYLNDLYLFEFETCIWKQIILQYHYLIYQIIV